MFHKKRAIRFTSALLLVAALGCDSPPQGGSETTARPEAAQTGAPVSGQGSAAGSAAAVAATSSAAPSADGSAASSATAASAPAGSPTGKVELPQPKDGILAAGEADKIIKAGAPLRVVLLDAGAEPRESLTYDFKSDDKQTVVLKLDMTMKVSAPGVAGQAVKLPAMAMVFDFATGKKDDKGLVPVTGTIADFKLTASDPSHEQMLAKMQEPLGKIKGMTVRYTVDARGHASEVKVELPKNAPPEATKMLDQMKQSLDVMASPLPAEPIGQGAKWQIVQRVTSPADIVQLSTVTLKKREGSKLELATDITQLAASSKLMAPDLPPGTTADLKSFKSVGTATMFVDLGKVAPDKGNGDVKASMDVASGPQRMNMDMGMKMTLSAKQ
jgi:hypothetical protein